MTLETSYEKNVACVTLGEHVVGSFSTPNTWFYSVHLSQNKLWSFLIHL